MSRSRIDASPGSPSGRLWFALVGAPLAWGAQITGGWLVTEFACRSHGAIAQLSGGALRAVNGAISLAALIVVLAALWIGIRAWRGSCDHRLTELHASERPDFLAAVSLFVAAAFTLGIVLAALGPILLPGCERMR